MALATVCVEVDLHFEFISIFCATVFHYHRPCKSPAAGHSQTHVPDFSTEFVLLNKSQTRKGFKVVELWVIFALQR